MPNEDEKLKNKLNQQEVPKTSMPIKQGQTMPNRQIPPARTMNQAPNQNLKNQAVKKGAQKIAQQVPGVGLLAHTPQGKEIINQTVDTVNETVKQQKGVEQTSTPLLNKRKGLSSFFSSNKAEEEDKKEKNNEPVEIFGKIKKYKLPISIGCSGIGCLGLIFVILFIVFIFGYAGDLLKLNLNLGKVPQAIYKFGDNIANIFSGCGFQGEEKCLDTQRDKFYEELKNQYNYYQRRWGVSLDISLIASTLTYRDISTLDGSDDNENDNYEDDRWEEAFPSMSASDYRKVRKVIKSLADHMAPLRIIEEEITTINDKGEKVTEIIKRQVRTIDLEGYKEYLQTEFIKEFYFSYDESDIIQQKVDHAIREIYMKLDFYNFLVSHEQSNITLASQCNYNMTRVNVVSCDNRELLATTSLKEYIMGVVYGELGYSSSQSDEYYKTKMVAAKTFALSRGRYDSTTKVITLRSCEADQIWCDINTGCFRDKENVDSANPTTYPMGFELNTVNNQRTEWNKPLSSEGKNRLSSIYDEVANYLYLDENFAGEVTTLGNDTELHYRPTTHDFWEKLANDGNDFATILKLTGDPSMYSGAVGSEYATRKLYNLADYCHSAGYIGNGNYTLEVTSNGSINVNNPIDFFSQSAAGSNVYLSAISTNRFGKVIIRSDIYDVLNTSCGPTSFSMIVSAIGNIGYLDEYLTNVSVGGGNNDEKSYIIAKMHRYLADQGIQGYPTGYAGGLGYTSTSYNASIYAPLGIQYIARHDIGHITPQIIYDYLAQGYLIMYNIQGTQCSRTYGTDVVCGGFGNTEGGHFGVIYGYDAITDEFLVYNPSKTTFQPIRAAARYVPKLNSIAVFGGI